MTFQSCSERQVKEVILFGTFLKSQGNPFSTETTTTVELFSLSLSLSLSAEIGDFEESLCRSHLLNNTYIPDQMPLIDKIMEFHSKHMWVNRVEPL